MLFIDDLMHFIVILFGNQSPIILLYTAFLPKQITLNLLLCPE